MLAISKLGEHFCFVKATAPNEKPDPRRGYALFDLDQTLIPWDTQLLFCDFVLKQKPLRRLYLLVFVPLLPFAKLIGTENMKRVFLTYLWGMRREELEELAEAFVAEHFSKTFYSEMLEVLEQEKKSGRTVVLSSASPEIWVAPIAQKLGVDYFFATTVVVDPKVQLFPKLIGGNNKGANKLVKMREILPDGFDPSSGDVLPNSHGYSDSHADLPMLRICEEASLVHPTEKLKIASAGESWKVYEPSRPTSGKWSFAWACLKQAVGMYS